MVGSGLCLFVFLFNWYMKLFFKIGESLAHQEVSSYRKGKGTTNLCVWHVPHFETHPHPYSTRMPSAARINHPQGLFHADPHPGNMLRTPDGRRTVEPHGARLCVVWTTLRLFVHGSSTWFWGSQFDKQLAFHIHMNEPCRVQHIISSPI